MLGLLHRLELIGFSLREDLDEAELVQLDQRKAVDSLRAELKVLEDVVVPTLVENHKLVLERSRADAAVQVMRRADADKSVDRGER